MACATFAGFETELYDFIVDMMMMMTMTMLKLMRYSSKIFYNMCN